MDGKILSPVHGVKFSAYAARNVLTSIETPRQFVVLRDDNDTILAFTGLEVFAGCYTGRQHVIKEVKGQELNYIVQALNYVLVENFFRYRATSVVDVTMPMIIDFFEAYRTKELRSENHHPSNQSVDKCIKYVSAFFANVSTVIGPTCGVQPEELYITTKVERHGEVHSIYRPVYRKGALTSIVPTKNHNITEDVYKILVSLARIHDKMLVFGLILGRCAGLRGGEPTHLRRTDIIEHYQRTAIVGIEIDLRHIEELSSRGIEGGIKRKRMAVVYPRFVQRVATEYREHQKLLSNYTTESDYDPLFLNERGKAMSYQTYYSRFKKLVRDHLCPELMRSEQPELVAYGQQMLMNPITPHSLRHLFTQTLVEDGCKINEVMHYRGDSSPESALSYLSASEVEKDLTKAHGEVIKDSSRRM